MFCTKCGKKLNDDDRFCAYCGSEVRTRREEKYEDVVFNPPFKIEAQKKTEEILKATSGTDKAEINPKTDTVAFSWNLEGFPPAQPRKTEAVDFSWDSVVEKKNKQNSGISEIEPSAEIIQKADITDVTDVNPSQLYEDADLPEENVMSIDDLEKELFGEDQTVQTPSETVEPKTIWFETLKKEEEDKPDELPDFSNLETPRETENPKMPTRDERFYTFNQKTDAFEELLRKEKQRLLNLQNEDTDDIPETVEGTQEYEPDMSMGEKISADKVFPENIEHEDESSNAIKDEGLHVVEIIQPTTPLAVDTTEDKVEGADQIPNKEVSKEPDSEGKGTTPETPLATGEESKPEEVGKEQQPPSKDKLRYSDIFPRVNTADDGNNSGDSSQNSSFDEAETEEPIKKHVFLKVLITVLILLIVAEGVIIAVKFIAPESAFSQKVNNFVAQAVDLFTGGGDNEISYEEKEDDEYLDYDTYMQQLVSESAAKVKTIGQIEYDKTLLFDMTKDYGVDQIADSQQFVDAEWKETSDGTSETYGQGIMKAVVGRYENWKSSNKDSFLVGINKLDIGEVRTAENGFYVLCRITYAGADGKDVLKYQVSCAEVTKDLIVINSVEEVNN